MLSKSKFVRGEKCQKSLWLYVHHPDLAKIDDSQLAIMNRGTNIGVLAREYFPGGVMAVEGDYPTRESAHRTQELIAQGIETIYEATFIYDDTLVAVDILTKIDGGWKLFECKSSASVKDYHYLDLAVQVYVVSGTGVNLTDASVMHLNGGYVRRGDLDVQQLFTCQSIFHQVMELQAGIPLGLAELKGMLNQEEPLIEMGNRCTSPFGCEFQDYCRTLQSTPEPDHVVEIDNTPTVHHDSIRSRLSSYGYPLYFLDFETIMPALPLFDESRPYQQIPFQYSLHYIKERGGELIHSDYLAWPDGDPRPGLIRYLIENTRGEGKILAYYVPFERSRINEMARDFPEYADELHGISNRLDDLALVFSRKEYHFPSMGNGYSIKTVLPLMVPELSYEGLEIANGLAASSQFEQLYGSTDTEFIVKTRADLLKYCHLDTLAMVKILGELEAIVR